MYLIILSVVIVGAILREINLLIILSGLMFGPLWISWYLVRSTLKRVKITRDFPAAVYPGELLMVDVHIENEKRRLDSWGLIYEDRVRHTNAKRKIPAKSIRSLVPYIKAKASERTTYRCRLWERGRYRLGPARISTQMPLGLLRGDITFRKTDEVLVYPMLGSLTGKWAQMVKADRPGQRSWHRSQGQVEGDFYGLRAWRSGDCRRWIHWRSSAKRNELVVRQFEQLRTQDFVIMLDLWLDGSEQSTDEAATIRAIERAISFAATVVAEHCRHASGHITLGVAAEQPQVVRGPGSSALLSEALELLADVRATPNDSLNSLLSQLRSHLGSDDRIVLVSTRDTSLLDANRIDSDLYPSDQRTPLAQSICINTTDPSFSDLFTLDELEELAGAT